MFEQEKSQLSAGISDISRYVLNFIDNVANQVSFLQNQIKSKDEEIKTLRDRLKTYEPEDSTPKEP